MPMKSEPAQYFRCVVSIIELTNKVVVDPRLSGRGPQTVYGRFRESDFPGNVREALRPHKIRCPPNVHFKHCVLFYRSLKHYLLPP